MLAVTKWTVNLQDLKYYLFKRQFLLRSDIVLQNEHEQRKIIIDMKNSLMELVEYYGV